MHVCEQLLVVVGIVLSIVHTSWHGHLSPSVFVGDCWWLLEVVNVGSHHWLLLLALVVVRGSCGSSCVLMVVVRRKEATSHIVTLASHLNFHVRSHVDELTCK